MKAVFAGTYDSSQPRINILKNGLEKNNIEVFECNIDIWSKIPDKSLIRGFFPKIFLLIKWISSYPYLIFKYLQLPGHDFVILSYPGVFDIFFWYCFASLKRAKILWDAYIPLYDCIVNDRKIIKADSAGARILYLIEFLSVRLVDGYFLDTKANARYFENLYKLKPRSAGIIPVGAEEKFFSYKDKSDNKKIFKVLFWGKFIPLQGTEIIVRAAQILENKNKDVEFTIVGFGQESEKIDNLINELGLNNVKRLKWAECEELLNLINNANVCLGIFGITDKTQRVIPNKVYQALAAGKTVITADTPAIRELNPDNIHTVEAGSPDVLAEKIIELVNNNHKIINKANRIKINSEFVGKKLKLFLQSFY